MSDIDSEIVAKATAELATEVEKELNIPTPSPDLIASAISSSIICTANGFMIASPAEGRV